MFDWLFKPSCPCDPAAKEWIEERLDWLTAEFDDHAFNGRRIVLPTREFFPEPFDGSEESVRTLLETVCGHMDVVPDLLELQFTVTPQLGFVNEHGQALGEAAGTYQEHDRGFVITVDKAEMHDYIGLVGTLAHELAHVRLMGENRIGGDAFDNEILTDLTVVHFGLGIFLANTPRNWPSAYGYWPDTHLLKPEYLTPPMFGWALAHLAWFRGEEKPEWAKYLNSSARSNLKQGLRYLHATGDSGYKPARLRGK